MPAIDRCWRFGSPLAANPSGSSSGRCGRAFSPDDVPIARRIGDHVSLAVSHERLAEIAQQAAEARPTPNGSN
jgi:GAF domain-containing protein